MNAEHQVIGKWSSAPRKVWIHPAGSGAAKDCLLFLDGDLYRDRVKAPDIIRGAHAAGTLPALDCVYLSSANAADRHASYTCHEGFASFVALEMPPWIEREVGRHERLLSRLRRRSLHHAAENSEIGRAVNAWAVFPAK